MIAYKGILKEKEALEASVKALSSTQPPVSTTLAKSQSGEEAQSQAQFSDPLHVNVSMIESIFTKVKVLPNEF